MSDTNMELPHPDEVQEWYENWVYAQHCNDKEARAFGAGIIAGFARGHEAAKKELLAKDEQFNRWAELCEKGHGATVAMEIRRAQEAGDE